MPDGAENEITLKVANIIPFIVMKGMAIWERYSEKDAYDIYFTIKHYPDRINALIDCFKSHISSPLVREGLEKICAKFSSINFPGPVWVANFFEIEDSGERERVKRDVFERLKVFLDGLGIKPFNGKV